MTDPAPTSLARRLAATVPRLRRLLDERDMLRGQRDRLRQERDGLSRQVEVLEGWPHLDYLFVVTYGRSGSTLVQGILNSIPGYLIRGENRQVMRRLFEMHETLKAECERNLAGRKGPTDPWFGISEYPAETALDDYRRLALATILRPARDTRVVGFKEIRWDGPDLPVFIDFLSAVFPGARFVVNVRDLTAVATSKWWADEPDALGQLQRRERQLLAECERLGERAHLIRYDDFVADPGSLAALFAWLGEPFDRAAVEAVLAKRHSY